MTVPIQTYPQLAHSSHGRASSNMLTVGAQCLCQPPQSSSKMITGGGGVAGPQKSAKFVFILSLFHVYVKFVNHEK